MLSGGRRIRDVKIQTVRVNRQADPTLDDYLEIRVNKPGDFSDYTLSLVNVVDGQPTNEPMDGFDPRYSRVTFSFKASCPTDLDCKPSCTCPPPARPQPDIDYLAKDYESFRQLILDRLALTMPAWQETHAPDLGITLVELLAYVGDYLSYYQDAVATEAYLGTARQRISVRRHARLVDYLMHDGCNARAWLTIWTDADKQFDPAQIYFVTPYPGAPIDRHLLTPTDLLGVDASTLRSLRAVVLDRRVADHRPGGALADVVLHLGRLRVLPGGWRDVRDADRTAGCEFRRSAALKLKVGDILIFEEVIGPKTGQPSDADPSHRQAVRLTKVTPRSIRSTAGRTARRSSRSSGHLKTRLTFPLCLSSQAAAA